MDENIFGPYLMQREGGWLYLDGTWFFWFALPNISKASFKSFISDLCLCVTLNFDHEKQDRTPLSPVIFRSDHTGCCRPAPMYNFIG